MDLSALLDAAPELLIAFGVVAAIAWFRKQDRQQLASMQAEVARVRLSQSPAMPAGECKPGDTGRYAAVVDHWERLDERLDGIDSSIGKLGETLDDEIRESRKFREGTGQRVTALETDVKWLRRGKNMDDTHDDRGKS